MADEVKGPCSPSKTGGNSDSPEVEIAVDVNQESPSKTTSLRQTNIKPKTRSAAKRQAEGEGEGEGNPRKKSIFDGWKAKPYGIMPFTFITNLFAALWGANTGVDLTSFTCKVFFLLLMINFYASVIGILLWHVCPMVANGFQLLAFLCAVLSLTMLFFAVVSDELKFIPWICMTIVLFLVIGLLFYELSSLPTNKSS